MKYLAHRGFWVRGDGAKNSEAAMVAAFSRGWGVETDLRDAGGEVVISHDPAGQDAWALDRLLQLHADGAPAQTLALNVKSDGLAAASASALLARGTEDAFAFDMSVPDHLAWLERDVQVHTRWSDIEPHPVLLQEAAGVWLDNMRGVPWWSPEAVEEHLAAGRSVAFVSPELHRRPHLPDWTVIRDHRWHLRHDVLLCTDFPDEAEDFFA